MAKVRNLRDFYKTVTKKNNGNSDDKVPPFLSSASGSVNQANISIISNETKSYTQHRKNYNTSVPERIWNEVGKYMEQNLRWRNLGKNILNIPL